MRVKRSLAAALLLLLLPGVAWTQEEEGPAIQSPEGVLRPGAFASVGLGVDNAR
jgi:hypothetical protein